MKKYFNFSPENYHFYSREISQSIAWTCLRNGCTPGYGYVHLSICYFSYLSWFREKNFGNDCVLSWSLLTIYLLEGERFNSFLLV